MSWWDSILNPIKDIENIASGLGNLFTNPSKQINKYILPAAEEALPAAAAVATGIYAPNYLGTAITGAIGTYGTQLATEGIGKMTSGTPPSIGDYLAGAAAAGTEYAIANSAGSSTLPATANNAGGGALSTLGGLLKNPLFDISAAGLGLTAYEELYAAPKAKQQAQQQQQQAQQAQQQSQQQSLCQQLEGMTTSQLALANWSGIVPNISPSCKTALAGNFTPKIVAAMIAAEKIGQLSSTNLSSFESILSTGTLNTATQLFNNCSNYAASPTTFGECINSSYSSTTGTVTASSPNYTGTNVSQFSQYPLGSGQIGSVSTTPTSATSQPASSFPWETVLLIGGGGLAVYIVYKMIAG